MPFTPTGPPKTPAGCSPRGPASKQHKITIRCIPLDSVPLPQTAGGKCFLTGKETAVRALWGRSY
ncbi:MAG: hypothetical protein MUC40_09120 [Akkermansiaceae bacterium]|nr:hypothetical protein [Akkermansiaceae bacterium]